MKFLLDTSAIINYTNGDEKVLQIISGADGIYTSALCAYETLVGSFSDQRFVEGRIFNYDLARLREFGRIRQPVLVLFGSRDEGAVKPVKEYVDILRRNSRSGRFSASIIKGARHSFEGKEEELADTVTRWLCSVE